MSSIELHCSNKIDSTCSDSILHISNVRWVLCMEVAQWRRNGGVRQERLSKKKLLRHGAKSIDIAIKPANGYEAAPGCHHRKGGEIRQTNMIVPLLTDHPPFVLLPGPQQMRNLVHGF